MKKVGAVLCVLVMLLAGCWDMVDIEKKGFVIGSAIDMRAKNGEDQYTLALTNQFVVPSNISNPSSQGGGGAKPYTNRTVDGISLMVMNRKMSEESSRPPFYGHLKQLIVSEDVVKEKNLFASILDLFIRDQEMRRDIKVIISKGEAKKVLNAKSDMDNLPALYLDAISKNSYKTLKMMDPVTIGDVHGKLLNQASYVLPKVQTINEIVKYEGGVVFGGEENKMLGELNAEDTKALNLATKTNKTSVIEFEYKGHLMVFELEISRPAIKIENKDPNHMTVKINIAAEGSIAEMFGSESLIKGARMEGIQDQLSKRIEKLIYELTDKLQNDLNADVLGINNLLRQKHPDVWNKAKDNWEKGEKYFSKIDITVSATAQIQAIGATDRAKWREQK